MYPARFTYITPEAALAMADDFYAACGKIRDRLFAVRIENQQDAKSPLILYPPKGVSAADYKTALLLHTKSKDIEALAATDKDFKEQIRNAFSEASEVYSEKTVGRALIKTVIACGGRQP